MIALVQIRVPARIVTYCQREELVLEFDATAELEDLGDPDGSPCVTRVLSVDMSTARVVADSFAVQSET